MDRLLTKALHAAGAVLIAVLLALQFAAPAAAQDAAAGGRVFTANCAMCHMAASGGHAMIGPNLFGVVGRAAGTAPGFHYSSAMQHSGITWTPERIAQFVQHPTQVVHGTLMTFAGLHDPAQAAAVAAYLNTLH